jgi:hypothetical protein
MGFQCYNRVSPVAEHVGMYVVDPYQYMKALFALYLVIIYSLTGYSAED